MDVRTGSVSGPPIDRFEEFRRELTGYCYRMLGSSSEAEDAVQDTMVKAWRSWDSFEGRASIRTWLYRIAHHARIDMHRSPQRRATPMDLGPATDVADVDSLGDPGDGQWWVDPIADDRVIDPLRDPVDLVVARESIRLAFVVALQRLPPRQRAAIVLCDVLQWSAADTAELLESTVGSVNSALQRARASLGREPDRDPDGDPGRDPVVGAKSGEDERAVLDRYVDAFERYDIDALVTMMRDDVVLSMPPYPLWLQGPDQLAAWYLGHGSGCRGSKLVPIRISGTTGFATYKPPDDGTVGRREAFSIQIVEVVDGMIIAQHNFLTPERFAEFGLPLVIDDDDR